MATDTILNGHQANGAKPSGYRAPANKLSVSILNLDGIKIHHLFRIRIGEPHLRENAFLK